MRLARSIWNARAPGTVRGVDVGSDQDQTYIHEKLAETRREPIGYTSEDVHKVLERTHLEELQAGSSGSGTAALAEAVLGLLDRVAELERARAERRVARALDLLTPEIEGDKVSAGRVRQVLEACLPYVDYDNVAAQAVARRVDALILDLTPERAVAAEAAQ